MIKKEWLHILISLMIKPLIPIYFWGLWVVSVSLYLYLKQIRLKHFVGIMILAFVLHQFVVLSPTVYRGWVVYQDDMRTILSDGKNNFTIFDTNLTVGDYLVFDPVQSSINSEYKTYASLRHQYTINELGYINTKKSSTALIKLSKLQPAILSDFMYSVLGYTSDFSEFHLLSLLISTGIIFSSFISLLRKGLSLILYQKMVHKIVTVVCLIMVSIVPFSFISLRILLSALSFHTPFNTMERRIIIYSTLLIVYPLSIYSLSFWFPFVLSFYRFLSNDSRYWSLRIHWLLFLQLNFIYQANLFSILLFPLIRTLSVSLASLVVFVYGFGFGHSKLAELLMHVSRVDIGWFSLVGKPPLLVSMLWLICLIKYDRYRKWSWIFVLIIYALPWLNPITTLSFIDVKQGDATLLRLPYSKQGILIDTGKANQSRNVLNEIKRLGITSLKYVIITHEDEDHMGGLFRIEKHLPIDQYILNKQEALQMNHPQIQTLLTKEYYDNDNDNSIILVLTIDQYRFLLPGDISKDIERDLIERYPNLKVEVIKLAHHGSKTSSDIMFLSELKPKLAIISAQYRLYRHPSIETLATLNQLKINYLSTEQQGTIRFNFSKYLRWIETNDLRIRF